VPKIAFWEACVIENDCGLGNLLLKFKFDDRIDARGPTGGPPSLDDSLVGNKFYVSSNNLAPEDGKGASHFAIDFRRLTREATELLGIQERIINALRSRLNIDLLVEIGEQPSAPVLCVSVIFC